MARFSPAVTLLATICLGAESQYGHKCGRSWIAPGFSWKTRFINFYGSAPDVRSDTPPFTFSSKYLARSPQNIAPFTKTGANKLPLLAPNRKSDHSGALPIFGSPLRSWSALLPITACGTLSLTK